MVVFGVVGNRVGFNYESVAKALVSIVHSGDVIISGGASGVDTFAAQFARANNIQLREYLPDFSLPSPDCFFARNTRIAADCDVLIAFDNTGLRSGTGNTVRTAQRLGRRVIICDGVCAKPHSSSTLQNNLLDSDADVICITTNGCLKSDGTLVMGAGLAKQAASKWPFLPAAFGEHVALCGNVPCFDVVVSGKHIVSLPTKHDWRDNSDIDLIVESVKRIGEQFPSKRIATVKPGCGLGGLDWSDVNKRIKHLIDERWIIY